MTPDNTLREEIRRELTMFAAYANTLTPHKLQDPLDPIVSGAIDDSVSRYLSAIKNRLPKELDADGSQGKWVNGWNDCAEYVRKALDIESES